MNAIENLPATRPAAARFTWRSAILALSSSLLMIVGCADAPADRPELLNVVTPGTMSRGVAPQNATEYRLRLHHLHTGESIDVAYRRGDTVLQGGVAMLNHFLRDHRTGQSAHYPVAEFDLLHELLLRLHDDGGIIEIVCGYRAPSSNAFLRTRSAHTGVAEHSQHMLSQAIDLRVPGRSTEAVRDAALSIGGGGVGYYPQSAFVHVDVGPVRQWTFGSGRALHAAHARRQAGTHG